MTDFKKGQIVVSNNLGEPIPAIYVKKLQDGHLVTDLIHRNERFQATESGVTHYKKDEYTGGDTQRESDFKMLVCRSSAALGVTSDGNWYLQGNAHDYTVMSEPTKPNSGFGDPVLFVADYEASDGSPYSQLQWNNTSDMDTMVEAGRIQAAAIRMMLYAKDLESKVKRLESKANSEQEAVDEKQAQ